MKQPFAKYLGDFEGLPKKNIPPKKIVEEELLEDDINETILAGPTPVSMSHTSPTIEPPKQPQTLGHEAVTDNIIEAMVAMLNQIMQDIAALNQKLDSKMAAESVQPIVSQKPVRREITLKKDESGRIIGGIVEDIVEGD